MVNKKRKVQKMASKKQIRRSKNGQYEKKGVPMEKKLPIKNTGAAIKKWSIQKGSPPPTIGGK